MARRWTWNIRGKTYSCLKEMFWYPCPLHPIWTENFMKRLRGAKSSREERRGRGLLTDESSFEIKLCFSCCQFHWLCCSVRQDDPERCIYCIHFIWILYEWSILSFFLLTLKSLLPCWWSFFFWSWTVSVKPFVKSVQYELCGEAHYRDDGLQVHVQVL